MAANWETNTYVGRFENWNATVSQAIGGLAADSLYHYTFLATNNVQGAWAPESKTFSTGGITLEAVDPSASESGPDAGLFRVSRPATATNGALVVTYTLGGTAVNGSDYASLSGSVVIPDGAVSAEFAVTPLDDTVWQEGNETVAVTLSAGNYLIGAPSSDSVTIQDGDASPDAWFLRMPLQFAGYDKAGTLTNFPVLVTLGTHLSGFSYSQFLSGANGDLRFTDASMTEELAYEIESWDTDGQSRVWVRVPAFTNNATIWMLWRRPGMTAPSYTANGLTWSEKFTTVAHLSETYGTVYDSTANRNNGTPLGNLQQDASGVIDGGDAFDGLDDGVTFGTAARPNNNFTFSAWVKTSLDHQIDAESNSSATGTAGQRFPFDPEHGGNNAGAGLSVGTNGVSVYEHGTSYMPPLAVYSAMIGSDWNHVTVTYSNKQPRIYLNGALVRTGLTSPKVAVNAPYKIGLQSNGYGPFNGGMDEVRISYVTRSPDWVWATYMTMASNSVLATYGSVLSAGHPEIANLPASDVGSTVATLNGSLSATGMAETAVAVYWGDQDGGTDAGAWANTNWFSSPAAPGVFATNLTGLSAGTVYYFRYLATNAYGEVWAPATETLLTAAVTLQATDAQAAELPQDNGAVTVSRGSAQPGPLTVLYTLSGDAVNGVDFSALSGSVTIPAGSASAEIVIAPLFNRNYAVRPTDTVTLTLAPGGYMIGSPDAGTVTITNRPPTVAQQMDVPRNFIGVSADPVTGVETLAKTGAGEMRFGGLTNNTFAGDILVDVDGGTLRVGGVPNTVARGTALPNMTAANTITVKRGGSLYIDDNNYNNTATPIANRFGSDGNRPAMTLEGGAVTLNGLNVNSTTPQTFGPLTLSPGYSSMTVTRNTIGTPELVFSSLNQAKGSHVNVSGSSLGVTSNAHIRFTAPPALAGGGGAAGSTTVSILPGVRSGNDWVAYDGTAGMRPIIATEYNTVAGNDVNGAGATENVRMTNAITTIPPLTADKVINSLHINAAASATWAMANKLTLTSGQLISGIPDNSFNFSTGTLTAGSGADASLDVTVNRNTTYIRGRLEDNGAGKVALVKNGGASLNLDGSFDMTYSGGTFINEGTLNTGSTAYRRYLSTGPVLVNAGWLWLNQVGATANSVGDDYIAVNGGQINVATVAYPLSDLFNISAGSVIAGSAGIGTGLNSLDRGIGVPGATPNVTLAADAVIARTTGLSAPLNLTNDIIRNLGTAADLFYGLGANQDPATGAITVGNNTPFKGLSTDRSDRRWSLGTINVTPGTSEITFQGLARPGAAPSVLYFGNWLTAGGPILMPSDTGTLTANLFGSVSLDDTFGTYGNTSAGKFIEFAVKPGATLTVNRPDAMGTATGIASARVEDGGTLQVSSPAGINGAVTVEAGGRLLASNAGGMTGGGAVTLESGSVLDITQITGFSGPQASAAAAAAQPGVIVRLNVDNFGTPSETLDSYLDDKAPVYVVYNSDRRAANPLTAGTTVMTLNKDAATGKGGMLVNDGWTRTLNSAANGLLKIGANGGTIAATAGSTLSVPQPIDFGANALTIGATDMVDRVMIPKLGTVQINSAFGLNKALPGSSLTVIPGATLQNTGHAIPDDTAVTVNGTLFLGGSENIGSLAGVGLVNLQGNTLTAGRDNSDTTFSGLLTNTVNSALFIKAGAGRMTVTGRQPFYTGLITVNNGVLEFSNDGGTTNAGSGAFTLSGAGTLELDNAGSNQRDRLSGLEPGIIFNGGTFRFIGKSGEASGESLGAAALVSGAATIDVVNGAGAGSSSELRFASLMPGLGTVNFTASNGNLGSSGDNPRVFFGGLTAGMLGFATVGGVPAYYSTDTGVRAFTVSEGVEFNGTADQTGLNTVYTPANNHLAMNAVRSVNSLWIDSPGAGYSVNLGSSGSNSLVLSSGRLLLTGADDFSVTRSGTSTGVLTREANGTIFLGVSTGRTLTVSAPISNGPGQLEKDGGGTLVLNASNPFTGALTVNDGTVRYASGGDLNGNAVNIWNSGVLDFAGRTDTLGTLTIYSGGVTNTAVNGVLTVGSLNLGNGPTGSKTYVGTDTGTLKLNGNVAFNSLNDPDMALISGKLELNGSRTFTVNNSVAPGAAVDMEVKAVISGASGQNITKAGAGVLKLSGANTFNGNISAGDNSGTIIASHPAALGAPTAPRTLSIGNNDTLALDGAGGNIVVPANYTNLTLNGAGDYQIGPVRGALTSVSGSNTVACPILLTGNAVHLAALPAGSSLTLQGNISGAYDLNVNGDGDMYLGGVIATTSKALTKNGEGTLTLSGIGTNTFSGTTTVNNGKLVLAKGNGTAPMNAIAGGAVNINNGGVLQYAASSTNPDLVGNGNLTVNGLGQLDFNGASDFIGAVTVSATGATADNTAIKNTAGGGNLAINGLTINPANGYRVTIDSGTGLLTLSNNVTFNAATTGRALISGNLALGFATRTFAVGQGNHTNDDLAIDAVISGGAGIGITKTGTGVLRLSGANTFDGNLSVGNTLGSVILANSQALGVPSTARTVSIGTSDTLALDDTGVLYNPSSRISLSLNGTGDTRFGGVSGALVSLKGTNTVPCAVTLAGTTQIASLQAGGKLVLDGAFSGAQTLTVAGPGETAVAGLNGTILAATSITVLSNGVLTLENSLTSNKTDRIGNTIPLSLLSAAIRFSHDGGAAHYTEALGALTLTAGSNAVYAAQAMSGRTSALVFASMTCVGGTVNFTGEGLGESAQNRIFILNQPDGLIGPWATINGTNLASYSAALGVHAATGGSVGVAARGGAANSFIPDNAGASAVISDAGVDGPITLEATLTNRVLEVVQDTGFETTVLMSEGVTNRTLQTSRLMMGEGKGALTIGEGNNVGTLTALYSGGTLSLDNRNAASNLTVKAAITDFGAASGLTKFGAGTVVLMGSNAYTKGTLINNGVLEFGGALTQKLVGVISGAGALAKSGSHRLDLFGTNTYTGPTYLNAGMVRVNQSANFGTTASGTYIGSGATLNLGCTPDVGGVNIQGGINMQAEPLFVSGDGCDGAGAIVNVATGSQMNAIGLLTLTGNASFGGPTRWDLRNYPITLSDNVFTKTGACEIAFVNANVIPGSGRIQINQGLLRFEGSTCLYGSTNNTVTVNTGATLDLWDLYPYVPEWTMLLNDRGTFRVNGTSTATNRHVWAGPVSLSGTAFVQCNLNSGSGTIGGDISGSGKLVRNGSGSATLWLLGTNNTYSGGTLISNGTVYARAPGSLPGYDDGRLTVIGGATLAVHATDGVFGFTGEQVSALNAMSTFAADDAVLSIDTSYASMQVLGNLTNRMGLTKLGTNVLTLSGLNLYGTGNTRINNGELVINGAGNHKLGAIFTATAAANLTITSAVPMCVNVTNKNCYLADSSGKLSLVRIGGKAALTSVLPPATVTTLPYFYVGQNGVCVLRLEDDASVTNRLIVGSAASAAGAVYQSGNSVMHNWGGQATDGRIGQSGYGYYELNSGTFTNNGYFQVGVGLAGVGILRQTDGAFKAGSVYNGQMGISRGGTGVVYTAGGTFNTSVQLNVGEISENSGTRGFAEFTVDGTALASINGIVNMADRTNMFAAVNLNGGVLAANQISKSSARTGSTALVNFDGGTLRARVSGELFGTGSSSPNAVNVYAGGAVIDTTNFNCTVSVPLRAPAGSGVVDIGVTPRDGYIGPPMVTIFGGGGTGATAIAQFDSNSGFVSGILMTCPGFGYTSAPTVMLSGGGTNVQTAVGPVTLAANVSGGLTKLGNGTLTLAAANTFTGTTTIAAGTLKLGTASALMPNTPITLAGGTLDLNGFTITNMVSGTGMITNGTIVTDFSPAGAGVVGTQTVSLVNATVKGTYWADVTAGGQSDLLNIQGNIDLSNLDLRIVDTDALDRTKTYTIMTCTGTRTGKFTPKNLPDSRWHLVYLSDGRVQLLFASGTLIRVR